MAFVRARYITFVDRESEFIEHSSGGLEGYNEISLLIDEELVLLLSHVAFPIHVLFNLSNQIINVFRTVNGLTVAQWSIQLVKKEDDVF